MVEREREGVNAWPVALRGPEKIDKWAKAIKFAGIKPQ